MELQEHNAHQAPLVFPLPLQLHLPSRQVSEQSTKQALACDAQGARTRTKPRQEARASIQQTSTQAALLKSLSTHLPRSLRKQLGR